MDGPVEAKGCDTGAGRVPAAADTLRRDSAFRATPATDCSGSSTVHSFAVSPLPSIASDEPVDSCWRARCSLVVTPTVQAAPETTAGAASDGWSISISSSCNTLPHQTTRTRSHAMCANMALHRVQAAKHCKHEVIKRNSNCRKTAKNI